MFKIQNISLTRELSQMTDKSSIFLYDDLFQIEKINIIDVI